MPHLLVEYSANVPLPCPPAALLAALQQAMAEIGAFPVEDCKGRISSYSTYLIGKGEDPNISFVHATLRLLSGRDVAVRHRLATAGFQALENILSEHQSTCRISVEIVEMEPSTYVKSASHPGPMSQ